MVVKKTEVRMNAKSDERRKNIRLDTVGQLSANCRILSAETAGKYSVDTWHVRNISSNGVKVYCRTEYLENTMVFLNMDLDMMKRTVGVIGKIVWCRPAGKYFSAGISFCLWPEKTDQDALGKFVATKVSYGGKKTDDKSENSQLGLGA